MLKFGALALVGIGLIAALDSNAGAKKFVRTTPIGKGVTYTVIRNTKGPWRIRILTINPLKVSTFDVGLAKNRLGALQRTSVMAKKHGAFAAINGDYALPGSGRPVFAFAEDGELAVVPTGFGRNFSVDQAETAVHIGHRNVHAWVHEAETGLTYKLAGFNPRYTSFSSFRLAAFTPTAKSDSSPPSESCSARLRAAGPPGATSAPHGAAFNPNILFGIEQSFFVEKVVCRTRPLARQGGFVVSAPIGGELDPVIRALTYGEQIVVGWSLTDWENVFDTIGGNPTLIEDGIVQHQSIEGDDPFLRRHPRTGVGYDEDTNRVFMVVVDGRQPGYSVGMTLVEFTKVFTDLGADFALNVDGGGSTTMWLDKSADGLVNGAVVNRPSDPAGERAVSSSLLLLPGPDAGEDFSGVVYPTPTPVPTPTITATPTMTPTPTLTPTPGAAVSPAIPFEPPLQSMIGDPASIGGLADYLDARHRHLPRLFERTAELFRFERRR